MTVTYHPFVNDTTNAGVFAHVKALTLSAMNSQAKYSDYSEDQVNKAFIEATDLILAFEPSSSPFLTIPLALSLMKRNTITLTFTLPAGKGRKIIINVIEETVKLLRPSYDTILCQTYGFDWIKSSASYNKFKELDNTNHQTYVLKFNTSKPMFYVPIPAFIECNSFKEEPLIENACYDYVMNNGGPLLKELLNKNIFTEAQLKNSRFDVRGAILRPGQSQNPLGLHCDFFKPCVDPLMILFVTNGYSETRIYTEPCITHMADTNDWYKIIRQPEVASTVSGPYVVPKKGEPVIFTDTNIHEAKALTKSEMPDGASSIYRLMMRIVVYPDSRKDEIPTGGSIGISQVYMMTEQEM